MPAMTYHELYGEVPVSLLRAIKRYNVSQSDFIFLEHAGADHETMERLIKAHSPKGNFQVWEVISLSFEVI